jgi:hypothetical protein
MNHYRVLVHALIFARSGNRPTEATANSAFEMQPRTNAGPCDDSIYAKLALYKL